MRRAPRRSARRLRIGAVAVAVPIARAIAAGLTVAPLSLAAVTTTLVAARRAPSGIVAAIAGLGGIARTLGGGLRARLRGLRGLRGLARRGVSLRRVGVTVLAAGHCHCAHHH